VVRVAQSVALVRHVDLSTVVEQTDRNAERLYGAAVTAALNRGGTEDT
jgi:hypothetical protein